MGRDGVQPLCSLAVGIRCQGNNIASKQRLPRVCLCLQPPASATGSFVTVHFFAGHSYLVWQSGDRVSPAYKHRGPRSCRTQDQDAVHQCWLPPWTHSAVWAQQLAGLPSGWKILFWPQGRHAKNPLSRGEEGPALPSNVEHQTGPCAHRAGPLPSHDRTLALDWLLTWHKKIKQLLSFSVFSVKSWDP